MANNEQIWRGEMSMIGVTSLRGCGGQVTNKKCLDSVVLTFKYRASVVAPAAAAAATTVE